MINMVELKMHKVLTNIPADFVVDLQGKPYPTYNGLMYLAVQMGKPVMRTKIVSNTLAVVQTGVNAKNEKVFGYTGEVFAECEAYLIPNSKTLTENGMVENSPLWDMWKIPTIAHGTVNGQNTRPNMMSHATVLAETRAKVRALRDLTGCTYTAYEEMQEADFAQKNFDDNKVHSLGEIIDTPKKTEPTADLFNIENPTRKDYILAIQKVYDVQPYKGILDTVILQHNCGTKFDVWQINEYTDDVLADAFNKCKARIMK